jgi:hypothetical protein
MQEIWINNNNMYEYLNNYKVLRFYHYYGKARKYCICVKIKDVEVSDIGKAIKEAKSRIKEAKKYITPLHGITEYIN